MIQETVPNVSKNQQQRPARAPSLEKLQNFWYVACLSESLRKEPLSRTIVDHPIVLFRDPQGRAHALLDRCCHRDLPLSFGKITARGIQCGYHGWEFSTAGQCVRIPGKLPQDSTLPRSNVPAFPVVEQDGLIWVFPAQDREPLNRPLPIPFHEDPTYGTLLLDFGPVKASVENALDNFMDSLHTPFVHPGLIYNDRKRNALEIAVRPYLHPDGHAGVEGCYLGEPAPTQGLIGRIFADGSTDAMIHEERFIAPTLSQVEFRIGVTSHLLSTQVLTPETQTCTRLYLVLRVKSKIPKFLTTFLFRLLLTRLLRQDIRVLEQQQAALESVGDSPRVSSELDLLSLTTIHFFHQLAEGKAQDNIVIKPRRYAVYI